MSPSLALGIRGSRPSRIQRLTISFVIATTFLVSTAIRPATAAVGQWWNGFSQDGLNGTAYSLLVDEGRLLVGGSFTQAGDTSIENIVAFDGQAWSPPSSVVTAGFPWTINRMALHEGRLHVASPWRGIFELVENGWSILDTEPDCYGGFPLPIESMLALDLVSWNGDLHSVGYFWAFESPNRPLWNSWTPECFDLHLPSFPSPTGSGEIQRVIGYEGDVILAGDFYLELAVRENMLRWNRSSLEAFDQGFFVPTQDGVVTDLELYGESLLAFGWLQAGNWPSGLVEYDGQQWGDFEGGRVDGRISAATVHDGMVYIAGDFTEIQGVPAAGLARWTGLAWESLADTPIIGADRPVYDMLFFNGQLYLAGDFGAINGVESHFIARWYPPLAVDMPPFEGQWQLRLSAAPNPFNPQTTIRFELRGGAGAELDIYDLAGRRISGTSLRSRGEGPGTWTWNGRDAAGRELASGVYFVRLREGNQEQRIRITLLK